jgi:hypothetical protein
MTIDYSVTSQKVREDIGAMRLSLNFLRLYQYSDNKLDGFVKSRHSGENRSPETL